MAYYYFNFSESVKCSTENLVRSLISQLTPKSPLPTALEALYTHCQDGTQQPSFSELVSTLRTILTQEFTTFIVIDALEECRDVDELMSFLHTMLNMEIRLLCTSRKERIIEEAFEGLNINQIAIKSSEISDDIDLYIRARLQADMRLSKWPPAVQEEVRQTLMTGARGMFRWVACQIDTLRKCLRLDLLRKALRSLPKTLEETYMRMLLGIDVDYRQDALKVLQWIAFSARPLQLREVAEVIAIDFNSQEDYFSPDRRLLEPRDLQIICSSLITIVEVQFESRGVVERVEELRLAHFSVKEYLTSPALASSRAANFIIAQIPADSFIADSCLAYTLTFVTKMPLNEGSLQAFPLIRYATKYWAYHALKVSRIEPGSSLWKRVMELFMLDKQYFENWVRVWDPDEPEAKPNLMRESESIATHIYYAALCGVNIAVRHLLNTIVDVDAIGGLYGTALQAAAAFGRLENVKLLVDGGANCNKSGGFYGTALSAASYKGHKDVVQLLLEKRADFLLRDNSGRTALSWAAEGGSVEIVEVLADAGSEIESQDMSLRTPLLWAVQGVSASVTEILIMRNAKIEARDKNRLTPLIWAAKKGHEGEIGVLLDHSANVHSKDARGQTALHWAAKRGHTDVIELLVRSGAMINEKDNDNQTALWWARKRNHQIVVDLLLHLGAGFGDDWWGESVEEWKPLMQDNAEYQRAWETSSSSSHEVVLR